MIGSGYTDTFARDNMPREDELPDLLLDDSRFDFSARINCAAALLNKSAELEVTDKVAIVGSNGSWSYRQLIEKSNQLAHVLHSDMGLVPGNRVLLRGFNGAMMAVAWLGIIKAGGIVVATMPMLRAKELSTIIAKAEVAFALCDTRLSEEILTAEASNPQLARIAFFGREEKPSGLPVLEEAMEGKSTSFPCFDTAAEDIALIAFTSGTTGEPKGAMHSHRDVMSMCVAVGDHLVAASSDDVFIGSPPLAFTFGLGMLLAIPLYAGASVILLEIPSPENLAKAIEIHGATICATAPTAYRAILGLPDRSDLSTLKKTVSAGEPLPVSVFEAWFEATGIKMIDGLGATEMMHIFVSASGNAIRKGFIGKALEGYEICILGEEFQRLHSGEVGRLAVKGPTGCKYLGDPRQKVYVVNGWNVTGDTGSIDEDGYFCFVARSDDMIISSGYNISPIEVESALLSNEAVAECAVIGIPDDARGHIVKAYIVRKPRGSLSDTELAEILKDHVKANIAPYKYPRAVEFIDSLPRTSTGKVQRFALRDQ